MMVVEVTIKAKEVGMKVAGVVEVMEAEVKMKEVVVRDVVREEEMASIWVDNLENLLPDGTMMRRIEILHLHTFRCC